MDQEAMLYVFGPLIAYCVGVAIAFGVHSYVSFKRLAFKRYER